MKPRCLLGFAVALAVSSLGGAPSTFAAAPRPNVVVLLSDALGYKDIGCYDGPVATPALDGLAVRGLRLTDFYSGAAVCSPSRATLLTGRHHIRTGVYSWIADKTRRRKGIWPPPGPKWSHA